MAAVEMNDGFFWGDFWGQVPDLTPDLTPDQVRDLVPDLSPKGMKRNQQGFTLMELMIVVAIVAILAAIALPAYQNSVTKTWRNKAASCLTEMSQTMERRFTGAMSYEGPTAAPAQLPPNTCTTDDGMATYYAFSFTADPTATAFTLQAVPQGGQAARDGQCATLTINQAGTRTASGTGGAAMCW